MTAPLPEGVELDYSRVTQAMGDFMLGDDSWRDELGHLAWSLYGFDSAGWADVTVMHKITGQVVGTARVHWSALAVGPAVCDRGAVE